MGDTSPERQCVMRQTTTNNKMTMIYQEGLTPAGPLALLQARIHYSIHPPPNGDVHVTNHKTSY